MQLTALENYKKGDIENFFSSDAQAKLAEYQRNTWLNYTGTWVGHGLLNTVKWVIPGTVGSVALGAMTLDPEGAGKVLAISVAVGLVATYAVFSKAKHEANVIYDQRVRHYADAVATQAAYLRQEVAQLPAEREDLQRIQKVIENTLPLIQADLRGAGFGWADTRQIMGEMRRSLETRKRELEHAVPQNVAG